MVTVTSARTAAPAISPVSAFTPEGRSTETTGTPVEVARQILALYYQPDRGVMPKQAEINMAGTAKVVEMLAETGQIAGPPPPVERFVDLQYLQAAGLQ